MELRLGRRSILALTVAGALAVGGGIAYAITIPDAGGVYRACMLNNVGTIRLIDKTLPASNPMSRCRAGYETEISWNQQGIQGIQGPAGKDGADGKDGPSDAFVKTVPTTVRHLSGFPEIVVSLALPAGSYVVTAKIWAANAGSSGAIPECALVLETSAGLIQGFDQTTVALDPAGAHPNVTANAGALPLVAAGTISTPGRAYVTCQNKTRLAGIELQDLSIAAVKVGTLRTG